MLRSRDFARCGLALTLAAAAAGAAPPIKLISNREIFDVSLEHTSGGAVAARGRTVVEFRVACDGYRTVQRSIADIATAQGEVMRTDFTARYWESRDGRSMRFNIANRQDGKTTDSKKGVATLVSNGTGLVKLGSKGGPFELPAGTIFPTGETLAVLNAARKGASGVTRTIFQGGDRAGVFISAATIGRPHANAATGENATDVRGLLKGVQAWPVLISFFRPDGVAPDSEILADMYANGVLGSLSLIYPDYTLRARLVRVDRLPSTC